MQAAVLRELKGAFHIEDVSIDQPGPHEVLLRTAATGVCHSDLHFLEGHLPIALPTILGHESAAVVEAVGSRVRSLKPGDHVITTLCGFCGHCHPCLDGHSVLCQGGRELRRSKQDKPRLSQEGQPLVQFANLSSFAEKMLMHENNTVKIPKEMPLDRAALVGCAVTTGAGAVFHTAQVKPGSSVCVIGCGGIGLSAINGAQIAGAREIIAVDIFDEKLELAKSMGATQVVNSKSEDALAFITQATGGVDYAFEAIGLEATLQMALKATRPGGTLTVLGIFGQKEVSIPAGEFLLEKKILGSYMGSRSHRITMPLLVDLYLQGRLHLDLLISKRVGLDGINQAFADLKQGGAARTIITFDA